LSAVASSEELEEHILPHACAIVAALSIGNITSCESFVTNDIGEDEDPADNELARAHKLLREAQQKEAPRWAKMRDDVDALLWIMGGYSWASQMGENDAEEFCVQNRVNSRQIAEAHSLMQQLGQLLKKRLKLEDLGIELELPLLPKPPSAEQAQRLRECILDGLIDRVAVAAPDKGHTAFLCADLGQETPAFVHNSSNVHRYRPRPSLMAFNEIISTTRPFMRDCVVVDPMSLSRRAARGNVPCFKIGEFLPTPAPRYLPDQDRVMAFASPQYTPLRHQLPTIELEVPADNIFRYKVFAQALLDGHVLQQVPPRDVRLVAKSASLLQAASNPRVLGLVGPLWTARIGSRAELLHHWKQDDRFLLNGYLKWLPASAHDDVRIMWPPIGGGGCKAK